MLLASEQLCTHAPGSPPPPRSHRRPPPPPPPRPHAAPRPPRKPPEQAPSRMTAAPPRRRPAPPPPPPAARPPARQGVIGGRVQPARRQARPPSRLTWALVTLGTPLSSPGGMRRSARTRASREPSHTGDCSRGRLPIAHARARTVPADSRPALCCPQRRQPQPPRPSLQACVAWARTQARTKLGPAPPQLYPGNCPAAATLSRAYPPARQRHD